MSTRGSDHLWTWSEWSDRHPHCILGVFPPVVKGWILKPGGKILRPKCNTAQFLSLVFRTISNQGGSCDKGLLLPTCSSQCFSPLCRLDLQWRHSFFFVCLDNNLAWSHFSDLSHALILTGFVAWVSAYCLFSVTVGILTRFNLIFDFLATPFLINQIWLIRLLTVTLNTVAQTIIFMRKKFLCRLFINIKHFRNTSSSYRHYHDMIDAVELLSVGFFTSLAWNGPVLAPKCENIWHKKALHSRWIHAVVLFSKSFTHLQRWVFFF